MSSSRISLAVILVLVSAARGWCQSADALEFFERRIRPILVENCHKCHGNEKSKGHLRLDSRAMILKGGDSGPAIVPGEPNKSLLAKAIGYGDPELRMPPRGKLPDAAIADLTKWIALGAPWPDDAKNLKLSAAKEFDLKARSRHWSLLPLRAAPLPATKNAAWVQSPIDAFILAKLEEKRLSPAPPAEPRTLLRRTYFDLIGLPPPPKDVDDFVAAWDVARVKRRPTSGDTQPDSILSTQYSVLEHVVDRLLASEHYGERWARHWLDLVRYAETRGHEFDFDVPDAWKYRDYVIRAFNNDVPYNQFVREHIAGDLLPSPRRRIDQGTQPSLNESILATAFWWLGEAKHSPVDSRADQADRIDNQIDVFGKAFLGMTVACARCHDHKFDAISTKDYYALAGYLQSSRPDRAFLEVAQTPDEKLVRLRTLWKAIQQHLPQQKFEGPSGLRTSGVMFASFSKTFGDWSVSGDAFGDRPSATGDFVIRPDHSSAPIVFVPPGLAHSGLLSSRLQGALRSPTFVIQHKYIHYRLAGKETDLRLVLNGLQLIQEPIYGGLKFTIAGEKLHWRTQDVSMWTGQRAYVEILDDGPGYAALEQVIFSDDPQPPQTGPHAPREALISEQDRAKIVPLLDEYRKAEASLQAPQRALATADGNGIDEFVFIRGNSKKLGEAAPRRFLEVFGGSATTPALRGSGRLELANHLLDPAKTPIVPRVLVNRVWQHHFGEGIVRSPDDFGVLGQTPTHPELLDYLAAEFVKNGWSLKKLHKMMILSSTYQQGSGVRGQESGVRSQASGPAASEIDPDNKLLHKMAVRRLEAEVIRDAILAVSGRLDRTAYGPSVPVHLTPFMVGRGRPAASGPLDGNGRRSIYIAVRRNFLTPMFVAFDYPTPFSTMGRRSVSNVPAQALTMLNNPLVVQQAELWAKRALAETSLSAAERVRKMYDTSLSRPPTPQELADALAFLDEQARIYGRADDPRAWAEFAHVLFNVKEFIFVN